MLCILHSHHFLKDYLFIYLFIFRERGKEGERGEKHQCVVGSCVSPTGDMAWNPGMCPDWELNQRPSCWQVSTQSTEPHLPWLMTIFITDNLCFFFWKDFIYLFLERWERKEKERERNINVWLPHVPPAGDLAHNPGMPALNPLIYTSQDSLYFLNS